MGPEINGKRSAARRLAALEDRKRGAAALRLAQLVDRISDAEVARIVAMHRRGDSEAVAEAWAAFGCTEALALEAFGPPSDPQFKRRLRAVFDELVVEPRRSAIKAELERLGA